MNAIYFYSVEVHTSVELDATLETSTKIYSLHDPDSYMRLSLKKDLANKLILK